MRLQHAPADENIRLALDDPEKLAAQQRSAIGDHRASAAKIECGNRPEPGRQHIAQPLDPEARDRREHQCPYAPARQRADQRDGGGGDGGDQVDQGGPLEIERPSHDRFGNRDEGGGEVEQSLHPQQVGDHRLVVIIRRDRRDSELEQGQAAIEQQHDGEGLPQAVRIQLVRLHQCADQPIAVEEGGEIQDHLGHREQAVIARIEQADDRQRYHPAHHLRHDLASRTPENRASYACAKPRIVRVGILQTHSLDHPWP